MGPALPSSRKRRRRGIAAAVAAVALAATGTAITVNTALADTAGCEVDYRVTAEWPGGFNADVTVTNLGDPVDGWRVEWTFVGGQRLQQGWNAQLTQTGSAVTAVNVDWNRRIDTRGSAAFGFTGTFQQASGNAAPTTFSLNGTRCTGDTTPVPTNPPTNVPSTAPTSNPPTPTPTPTSGPTGNPGQGNAWNPPSHLAQPLAQVWDYTVAAHPPNFRNYGWDQVMATNGTIRYCVRWDSRQPVTAATRDRIHNKLEEQYNLWFDQMVGWNDWPFQRIKVEVVGWAAYDRGLLQWDDGLVDVYIGDIRENAPQCHEGCGRFFNQNGQYPRCPGGYERHYDHSLWLTQGMGGGAGGDWGQRMGAEYFVNSLNSAQITIYLHELGHTYGLMDFYEWSPSVCCFIMKAGSSATITEFDHWMLRDWWRHLKHRYGL